MFSDEVWGRIEPLLPAQYGKGRPFRDHRQVIEGIVATGRGWRGGTCPSGSGRGRRCGSATTASAWTALGTKVLVVLQAEADAAGEIDWRVSVDSSSSRVHHHGATAARPAMGSSEASSSYTGGEIE